MKIKVKLARSAVGYDLYCGIRHVQLADVASALGEDVFLLSLCSQKFCRIQDKGIGLAGFGSQRYYDLLYA